MLAACRCRPRFLCALPVRASCAYSREAYLRQRHKSAHNGRRLAWRSTQVPPQCGTRAVATWRLPACFGRVMCGRNKARKWRLGFASGPCPVSPAVGPRQLGAPEGCLWRPATLRRPCWLIFAGACGGSVGPASQVRLDVPGSQKILVDRGFVVDRVHPRPPDPP